MGAPDLTAQVDLAPHLAVARLAGELRRRTVPDLHRVLGKLLADPGWVLADLSGLRLAWPASVQAFAAALTDAGGWPAARLILFAADGPMSAALTALGVVRTVPLATHRDDAERRLLLRPPRVHRRRDLPAIVTAPAVARDFLQETCIAWDVEDVYEDASIVVTELVANAVEHAGSASRLSLNLDARGFWISVRDFGTGEPTRIRPRGPGGRHGHGLHLVAALTDTWGVLDHIDGKTVWVRLPRPVPERSAT